MATIVFILFSLALGSYGLTTYQTAGLNSHNTFRAKHQAVPMSLDDSLNTAAESCAVHYANKKTIDHSCKTPNAGENLYMSWGSSTPPDPDTITLEACQAWYDENKDYNYQSPGSADFMKTGHFTQMVWNASTLLGIGVSSIGGYTVVVGKYTPWGNMRGGGADGYEYYRQNVFPVTGRLSRAQLPQSELPLSQLPLTQLAPNPKAVTCSTAQP